MIAPPETPTRRRATMRAGSLLLLVALAGACAPVRLSSRITPEQEWWRVADAVVAAADSGRYDAAARELVAFESRHPNTPLAADAMYWRALMLLDTRNAGGRPAMTAALLDSASALPAYAERHAQIAALRRVARRVGDLAVRGEQLEQEIAKAREIATGAQRAQGERAAAEPSRNLSDEVQRLREELAKANAERDRANAELQRVRRRLTTPTRP